MSSQPSANAEHPAPAAPCCERDVELPDPEALHARPATCIAQAASKFRSEITIRRENSDEVNAKSPLDILLLAALQGTRMTIRACGEDAEQALVEVVDAFRGVFAERMTGVPANREAGR